MHALEMSYDEFTSQLARVRPLRGAEKRAMLRWFKHLTMSGALRMAMRHGGRYLVINGGQSHG